MRNFKLLTLSIFFILSSLTACNDYPVENNLSLYQQDLSQLYISQTDTDIISNSKINYDIQYARWISYLDYSDLMLNKSETEYINSIDEILNDAKSQNINTIYFHVRAFGDAYYNSELFPKGTFLNQDYDALEIFIQEAHKLQISVHAWVNPLRCQTAEEFQSISDDFILKKWFNEFEGIYICNVDGRMWLNPAYSEVRDFISDGILEIIQNYDVDGIHIDDYFYPTTSEDFDRSAFLQSGQADLSNWRIENINKLITSIYSNIKNYDENILFGISPQGNINQNYSSQFADVKSWCSNSGYCDYIVPQIYFGFENDTCPFTETFNQWYDLTQNSDVSLVIGLAVYKQGKEDVWAGDGKNEWIDDDSIIQKQQDLIKQYNIGFSLYY